MSKRKPRFIVLPNNQLVRIAKINAIYKGVADEQIGILSIGYGKCEKLDIEFDSKTARDKYLMELVVKLDTAIIPKRDKDNRPAFEKEST